MSYKDVTASDLLRRIANEHGLKTGRVDDTRVVLPEMTEDNKTLADIISNALRKTEEAGGGKFTLYDDFGALTLVRSSEMRLDILLDESGGTGFTRTISVDRDTYNSIKLFSDTQKTGRQFFTASDRGNAAKWGKLQYVERIAADNNWQGQAKANALLNLYNKEQRTLSVSGVHGNAGVRAGCSLSVDRELSGGGNNAVFVVERARHYWNGGRWSMDLELVEGSGAAWAGVSVETAENRPHTEASDFAGIEYEQIFSDLPNLTSPVINNVNITEQGSGTYRLSISKANCTLDSRARPFFFFRSQNGTFVDYKTHSNSSVSVIFRANSGRRNILVGVGDSLGQSEYKTITL
jgi:hypothetical protein